MVNHALLLVLLSFFNSSIAQNAAESNMYEVNEAQLNEYKERICKLLPDISGEKGSMTPWSDELTDDEVYELALVNLGYSLSNDAIAHLPKKLGWKKAVIDIIAYIAHTTCQTPAITSNFINTVKNLFLYYIIKFEKSLEKMSETNPPQKGEGTDSMSNSTLEEEWNEIIKALSECAAGVDPIRLEEHCGLVHSFTDAHGGQAPAYALREQFDVELSPLTVGVDIIIDSIWWMFSTSYARCYAHFYPNEDIILLFFLRFRTDFMDMFHARWRGGGPTLSRPFERFDLIFGPIQAGDEFLNLRSCASAAYTYEGLDGRNLVRPVNTVMDDGSPVKNFKIEDLI